MAGLGGRVLHAHTAAWLPPPPSTSHPPARPAAPRLPQINEREELTLIDFPQMVSVGHANAQARRRRPRRGWAPAGARLRRAAPAAAAGMQGLFERGATRPSPCPPAFTCAHVPLATAFPNAMHCRSCLSGTWSASSASSGTRPGALAAGAPPPLRSGEPPVEASWGAPRGARAPCPPPPACSLQPSPSSAPPIPHPPPCVQQEAGLRA